ncbi:MAG: hypothetical protein OWV35_00020 [Firmicutes bacterium]|nr:hypothetical protein [Bacillota bacterium]
MRTVWREWVLPALALGLAVWGLAQLPRGLAGLLVAGYSLVVVLWAQDGRPFPAWARAQMARLRTRLAHG